MGRDITDRKQAEIALAENQRHLSLALQAAKAGTWEWNRVTNRVQWSDTSFQLYGYEPGSFEPSYERWLKFMLPEDRLRAEAHMQQAMEADPELSFEYRILLPDGSIRWILDIGEILYNPQGQLEGMIGIQMDITERKQVELALQEKEAQLRLALDLTQTGWWDWDIVHDRLLWNENSARLLGLPTHCLQVTAQDWLERIHPQDRPQAEQKVALALDDCTSFEMEYRVIWPNGSVHWLLSKGQAICDATGKTIRMIGVAIDINDRKLAEERLRTSLLEKEILLQEIHHRVKNNLQLISSMLDLQAMRTSLPEVYTTLQANQHRIYSIALVHESLYRSQNFAEIDFAEYIHTLVTDLFRTYVTPSQQVQLQFNIHYKGAVNLQKAIPCGLILNELVINALKHGLTCKGGTVFVSLEGTPDGQLILQVGNGGDNLPLDFELEKTNSLGLRLVNALVSQIQGQLAVERSNVTVFKVIFSPAA